MFRIGWHVLYENVTYVLLVDEFGILATAWQPYIFLGGKTEQGFHMDFNTRVVGFAGYL